MEFGHYYTHQRSRHNTVGLLLVPRETNTVTVLLLLLVLLYRSLVHGHAHRQAG